MYEDCKGRVIDKDLLDGLSDRAKNSPDLWMDYNLYHAPEDKCLILLKAIEPGSTAIISSSPKTSDTIICMRGKLVVECYDSSEGISKESVTLTPNGSVVAVNIPIGQWHKLYACESGTIIMEMVNGPYEKTDKE